MRLKTTRPEERSEEQKRSAAALEKGPRGRVGGPFLPLLEHPAVFDKVQELGEVLRFKSKLPGPLRELAILVCARHWTAQYEWWAHAAVGKKEGLSETIMAELKEGKRPAGMSEDEAQHAIKEATRQTGLPATDPVRYGAKILLDAMLAHQEKETCLAQR